MTQDAIDSLNASSQNFRFNILVFEQQKHIVYDNATTLNYDYPFNYNKILNDGIARTKNQHIILCNNDLVFHPFWFDCLYEAFKIGYVSLSPYEPKVLSEKRIPKGNHVIEGYRVAYHLLGWCIVIDREVIEKIGSLDESCEFWYSDNLYSAQLQFHKIPHGLVCNSFVDHITSQSIFSEDHKQQLSYTSALTKAYENALKKYR